MQLNLDNETIAIIGLNYVGLPLAVEFGKQRLVIGSDSEIKDIGGAEPYLSR